MTLVTDLTSRKADTSAPLIDALVDRWSPRAFDPTAVIDTEVLRTILEAARWAPSASNSQPWRFIVARRGSDAFAVTHAAMAGFNQAWADSAAALIVNVAETVDAEGNPRPWASLRPRPGGRAPHRCRRSTRACTPTRWAASTPRELHEAFGLADNLEVVSITTIGVLGDVDSPARGAPRARDRPARAQAAR